MNVLPASFYLQTNVVKIAQQLIGRLMVTNFNSIHTVGRIVETEAYNGIADKASHAYGGRRTNRTEIMYAQGGVAYVYLCYGVHHLFNVVTGQANTPQAVLIRALEPVAGLEHMIARRNKSTADFSLTKGPGSLSLAMGIHTGHTGKSLLQTEIFLAEDGFEFSADKIIATPRIGVDYAGEDALLPYRFAVKENPFVSGKKSVGSSKT